MHTHIHPHMHTLRDPKTQRWTRYPDGRCVYAKPMGLRKPDVVPLPMASGWWGRCLWRYPTLEPIEDIHALTVSLTFAVGHSKHVVGRSRWITSFLAATMAWNGSEHYSMMMRPLSQWKISPMSSRISICKQTELTFTHVHSISINHNVHTNVAQRII